jgi:hypothetical protein
VSTDTDKLISRRKALARLGALAFGAYCAPALTTLSAAEAKGSSSPSGSGNSGSGSGNSGSGSGNSGSGSSNSGSGSSSPSGSGSGGGSGSGSGSGSGNSGSGSGNSGQGSTGSGGDKSVFGGDGIHIQFSDGHTERIRNGRFEKLDRRGRIVDSHRARRSDLNRLRRLRSAAQRRGSQKDVRAVVEIDERRGHIEITDYRGWREIVSGSTYELKDPDGRTVTRRALTAKDVLRIRDVLKLE